MKTTLIDIENVSFQYDYTQVLKNISFRVEEGDFLALLGPNGSGKSTLLKILLGLLKPLSGEIKLFGEPSATFKHREWIGYVSQKSNAFNSGFPATVQEVVKSGLTKKLGLFKRPGREAKGKVREALKAVGMDAFEHRNIGELSGGQQQRVFIARALVSDPKLLILDEPTVGIDHENVQSFYDMLAKLNREQGITMILVTHDVDTVSNRISHVACLNQTIHFHGYKNEFDNISQGALDAWYGHSVRKIH
ncbi:ABC transporter ATP-binding protein [Lysinibacillus sp. FSL M8-0216]|uniref:Zinc transport system ATP-binding protein n=1 Tax=Lysinibacillus fusiformis TaxID=28031 RepID=A0A1H9IL55_9BACI|nr:MULTISPECIES: ABC transporter ATP-binding protein [Lysinibacillus]MCG7437703.1 ABC transporter ATP-binding protein [Lysinibacillus fusiformis]MED4670418.1 ABC transporter ATP-binding protein [Lysinibacillus fusiformis]NOG28754.1 ABC transporter ATP-binding protein [Lysinibacillus fusiformis]QAS56664.1 ABC transporter ATP-binding protein [Lysinibacillus sphaericus]RDV30288.1 ABC transporter ATP-binding protein [Lysinibacillus fusiformis]